ncbi:hypothetical protein Syun_026126 [Stephania yunnanensis]|uniref:GATA transcription factor n=1 Tax=Stephania yunnanensis TaxID=152371 RepID=A0AAP0ESX6_9MAGN
MDSPDFLGNPKSGENFIIDDLFDFSNEEVAFSDGGCSHFDTLTGANSTDSSTVTVVDSPGDLPAAHFSADLCLPPCEEFPELEWFSCLEEESFSSEDLEKLQLISGMKAPATSIATTTDVNISRMGSESPMVDNEDDNRNNNNIILISNNQILGPEISVPGKARSKRPRATTCNWSSRLPTIATMSASSSTSSDQSEMAFNNYNYENYSSFAQGDQVKKNKTIVKVKTNNIKKQQQQCGEGGGGGGGEGSGRRCLHCATEKTPQWRTGPMGPKTLCNACGVRYKSGRLVPEYRPAASPTFLQTKHSNSHRKVLELRRQKEVVLQQPLQQQQQHNQLFQLYHHQSNAGAMFDQLSASDQGYLIHHHIGPDFRQLL